MNLFKDNLIGKASWDTGERLMSSKYLGATLLHPNANLEPEPVPEQISKSLTEVPWKSDLNCLQEDPPKIK